MQSYARLIANQTGRAYADQKPPPPSPMLAFIRGTICQKRTRPRIREEQTAHDYRYRTTQSTDAAIIPASCSKVLIRVERGQQSSRRGVDLEVYAANPFLKHRIDALP